ncbi:MAG: hypothetical protein ACFB10_14965 [Salibacteraceae bacterium]
MNQKNDVPMNYLNDEPFDHFMDLVTDQDLWGVFRKINRLNDLMNQYLEARKQQMKLFPFHDTELEMELLLLHIELLQEI